MITSFVIHSLDASLGIRRAYFHWIGVLGSKLQRVWTKDVRLAVTCLRFIRVCNSANRRYIICCFLHNFWENVCNETGNLFIYKRTSVDILLLSSKYEQSSITFDHHPIPARRGMLLFDVQTWSSGQCRRLPRRYSNLNTKIHLKSRKTMYGSLCFHAHKVWPFGRDRRFNSYLFVYNQIIRTTDQLHGVESLLKSFRVAHVIYQISGFKENSSSHCSHDPTTTTNQHLWSISILSSRPCLEVRHGLFSLDVLYLNSCRHF